ncbi:MAG: SfnB family sulfur acquisition oxidoreductase [Solirubrobacteraceae bacterium]|nr:SfnB family sulfur acquisition oxidoreductase [Solirubrobacteraceae bacterium]
MPLADPITDPGDRGPSLPPLLRTHEEAVAAAETYAAAIAPGAADRDREGGVPWQELALLDRSGLLAITVPAALDGPELGYRTLAEVVRIIAAVDPSIAQVPQVHFLFPLVLWELGSPEARALLSSAVLAGGRVGNAQAERGGQHAQDLRTRLLRGADGRLRLSGTKYYCTGAISSEWIAVSAIDDSPDERQQLVYVRRDAEGVEVGDDWAAMGQRNTVSGTTTFTDVLVDEQLVLPYWTVFEAPQTFGARAQLVHAAIEVGIAGGALRDAGAFLRDKSRPFFEAVRGGWAERAADDPHTVHRFGELATRVAAAEALLRDAADALDRTPLRPDSAEEAAEASLAVARAKAFGSEVAVSVASELFALTGTSATDERYNLNRHWRNARTHSVHDPVSWKYHHIGAYAISGTLPPNHGQL